MEVDELAEVGLTQRVAVQREEAALELARREPDRAARPQRLVLDRVLEGETVVPVPEPRLDLVGEVAARDDRALDAVTGEVLERVREKRPVDEREHVLPRPVSERPQARSLTADEDDRREAHEPLRGSCSVEGCGEPGGSPRSREEGGARGKHGFPREREPKASVAHMSERPMPS